MKRRSVLLALLAAAIGWAMVAGALYQVNASASAGRTTTLSLGDRIRLDQVPVGCRVTRVAGQGKQIFLDCRRAGSLKGTYGTYFGASKVLVVRHLDARRAKVVFQARHEQKAERCR